MKIDEYLAVEKLQRRPIGNNYLKIFKEQIE